LQAIAFWILEKNLGLPIWISLADLQLQDGSLKNFGEYLRESWLGSAIANLTPAIKTEFIDKITSGQVWLLLDGVDEIVTSNSSPLQAISSQLVGWVAKLRVVLTCRLNVWEENLNVLEDFETYSLLDFNYPSQVKQFIENWFQPRNSNTTQNQAEELWQELSKPKRQRIQDLVRNPLRLALLCATWQSSIKGLPETKAGLYSLFVKHFYNWKSNRFSTKERQRRELNTALGNLAKIAIDGETSRFRLKYDLVSSVLGDADEEDSWFYLALKLGWLNKVGIAAESDIQEEVYAFYHPTFQEYFAAQAIDDWDFFLPREHKDRPIGDKDNPGEYRRYRIFELQWKQVILLWFGRDNNQISNTQKDNFIKALTYFNDGCDDNNFYGIKSYLLAGSSIAEYKSCLQADEIIRKIIRWGIGYFDSEQQEWYCSFEGIVEGAKITLIETDTQRKNDTLVVLSYIAC
jgi:predicted NACHT family NTPase